MDYLTLSFSASKFLVHYIMIPTWPKLKGEVKEVHLERLLSRGKTQEFLLFLLKKSPAFQGENMVKPFVWKIQDCYPCLHHSLWSGKAVKTRTFSIIISQTLGGEEEKKQFFFIGFSFWSKILTGIRWVKHNVMRCIHWNLDCYSLLNLVSNWKKGLQLNLGLSSEIQS